MDHFDFKRFCEIDNIPDFVDFISKSTNRDIYNDLNCAKIINSKKIVIFGCGQYGKYVCDKFNKHGYKVDFYCDNDSNKWGTEINSIPVISINELLERNNEHEYLIVISSEYFKEIDIQLNGLGLQYVYGLYNVGEPYNSDLFVLSKVSPDMISQEIIKMYNSLYDIEVFIKNSEKLEFVYSLLRGRRSKQTYLNVLKIRVMSGLVPPAFHYIERTFSTMIASGAQYFDREFFKYEQNESFVDIGAFNGDTVLNLLHMLYELGLDKSSRIYAIEPDESNYNDVLKLIEKLDLSNVNVVWAGVGRKLGVIKGEDILNCRSGEKSLESVPVITIDDYFKDLPVTFIKADIEGLELEALEGAKEVIKKNKPKLAICVYHKAEHLYQIPLWIHEAVPEYNLFLKHHSLFNHNETVIYASID